MTMVLRKSWNCPKQVQTDDSTIARNSVALFSVRNARRHDGEGNCMFKFGGSSKRKFFILGSFWTTMHTHHIYNNAMVLYLASIPSAVQMSMEKSRILSFYLECVKNQPMHPSTSCMTREGEDPSQIGIASNGH